MTPEAGGERPVRRLRRRYPRREAPQPATTDGGAGAVGAAETSPADPDAVTHLVIGHVAGPWGLKGEVKLVVDTDYPERFRRLRRVYLGDDLVPYDVERGRPHGRFAVLKLAGIDSPEAAEPLRRQAVHVHIHDAVPPPEGTWYWHQLIGLDVWTTRGEHVGTLAQILETGSNDVYIVKRVGGGEALIPAIESVIKSVDLDQKRMTIEPLPGMID